VIESELAQLRTTGVGDWPFVRSGRLSGHRPGLSAYSSESSEAIRFCNHCGNQVDFYVPAGDHLPRHVCVACGNVQYRNPKAIVGMISEAPDGRILMCKRAIPPRVGFWTFPAGYLENGETSGQGAAREAMEEAHAVVEPLGLYLVINAIDANQVYLIHRGRLRTSALRPTPESVEVELMREDRIPWGALAFPAIGRCIRQYFGDRQAGGFPVRTMVLTNVQHAGSIHAF
jgi:ADP-ribose pyrophosphatase YjhB (NUDIX family)